MRGWTALVLCCFFSVFFCFSSKFTSAFFFIFSELMLCKLSQCLINSVWIRAKIQNKRQMQTFKKITIIKVLLTRIVFKRIDNTHFLYVRVCVDTYIFCISETIPYCLVVIHHGICLGIEGSSGGPSVVHHLVDAGWWLQAPICGFQPSHCSPGATGLCG